MAFSIAAPAAANALSPSAPAITVNTSTVSPYGWVSIDAASGFGPNDTLTITVDGTDVTNQFFNITTDSNGNIPSSLGTIQIPGTNGGAIGAHTIVVTDPTSTPALSASATVQVVPAPSPTPATLQRTVSQMRTTGATFVFSGFAPGDSTSFTMVDSTNVGQCGGTLTADASGNVTVTCVWGPAFSPSFAAFGPGQYVINGGNSTGTRYSDSAAVTVASDAPAAPAPTAPVGRPPVTVPVAAPPAAAPAVSVSGNAHFTG
jgi:hypothetical protein